MKTKHLTNFIRSYIVHRGNDKNNRSKNKATMKVFLIANTCSTNIFQYKMCVYGHLYGRLSPSIRLAQPNEFYTSMRSRERTHEKKKRARPVNVAARPSIKSSFTALIRVSSLTLNRHTQIKCSVRARRRLRKPIYYAFQRTTKKCLKIIQKTNYFN